MVPVEIMIPVVQTLRVRLLLGRHDEFQRLTGAGAATNVEGGKSNYGERAQVIVSAGGTTVEISGKSPKVGNKRWAFMLCTGDAGAAITKGDEVAFSVDVTGGSALALLRSDEIVFAFGNVADLPGALGLSAPLGDGFTRVDLRLGSALARREVIAGRDELAFWLGHYVGGRRDEG